MKKIKGEYITITIRAKRSLDLVLKKAATTANRSKSAEIIHRLMAYKKQ